ncbi:MAG TPA: tRNA (adenosine(37)-N6)-dimethylallyltransferase MiaA [Gemmatimonadales bacterium]|nr:tRNA (adenosine(37)-N6)-dimethylallyltransferase MiaA [Gemmatimonadales bacterium]
MGGADPRPLVPVIVGATGVGKTAVAAALAARLPITVISADARQVYRGLDIGTAKPDPALRARVPHLGLDLVEPGERYSAGRFARDAAGWIGDAFAAGRQPVVVGGTGFYVRAVADGLFREPPLDARARSRVAAWADAIDPAELARWAGRLDRAFSGGGRQRAARAVEVALLTGRPLSWWQQEARATGVMRPWYIHLTLPRDELLRRIADRTRAMLARGLVAEVRALRARGTADDAPGLDGVGYRETVAMLAGALPEAELEAAIVRATRRYAKRQETWFRHQLRRETGSESRETMVWSLNATGSPEAVATEIHERWARVSAPVSTSSRGR